MKRKKLVVRGGHLVSRGEKEQVEQEDRKTKNETLPKALQRQTLTAFTKSTIQKITQPLLYDRSWV